MVVLIFFYLQEILYMKNSAHTKHILLSFSMIFFYVCNTIFVWIWMFIFKHVDEILSIIRNEIMHFNIFKIFWYFIYIHFIWWGIYRWDRRVFGAAIKLGIIITNINKNIKKILFLIVIFFAFHLIHTMYYYLFVIA